MRTCALPSTIYPYSYALSRPLSTLTHMRCAFSYLPLLMRSAFLSLRASTCIRPRQQNWFDFVLELECPVIAELVALDSPAMAKHLVSWSIYTRSYKTHSAHSSKTQFYKRMLALTQTPRPTTHYEAHLVPTLRPPTTPSSAHRPQHTPMHLFKRSHTCMPSRPSLTGERLADMCVCARVRL